MMTGEIILFREQQKYTKYNTRRVICSYSLFVHEIMRSMCKCQFLGWLGKWRFLGIGSHRPMVCR